MAAAADTSRSSATADSYIGSSISLTSKFEIRYEGILYNINTEESSIGLRNVRSFGTEGRKKDGPQIPPSDKIYEYILFRGSDIKDLQVKSSPPLQTAAPVHNDPAIIQSHYSHPNSTSTSMPSMGAASAPVPDFGSHAGQVGIPRTTFQGSLTSYQPGGSLGSWGPSLPTASGSGLGMPPMYWQGFYPPTGVPPHLQQPPFLRPPPGLSMPHSMQQPLQYPGIINSSMPFASSNLPGPNASLPSGSINLPGPSSTLLSGSSNLPEVPPSLLPPVSSTLSSTSTSLPSTVMPTQAITLAPEMPSTMFPNNPLVTSLPVTTVLPNNSAVTSLPVTTLTTSLPFVSHSASKLEFTSAQASGMHRAIPGQNIAYQAISQPPPTTIDLSNSNLREAPTPSLVTPGQLLQSVPSTISSSQPIQVDSKEVKVRAATSEPLELSSSEASGPILPLPTPMDQKPNAAALHSYHNNRGRGRGRGNGYSRPVTKFTEDFDFTAMNEKFKKDEVWGHLGKSKSHLKEREGEAYEDYDYDGYVQEEEEEAGSSRAEIKPVYVKDEFFDSLSCNSLDRGNRHGRTKFSEQRKLDSETFGEFPRYHANRGGGRGFRGGRTRGSYYNRGYGYTGRGRGYPT